MSDAEHAARQALRAYLSPLLPHGARVLQELQEPLSLGRADLAVITEEKFIGYEIKSERDTLKRLPAQVIAYGRIFDECWVAVAPKHLIPAQAIVPEWWGVLSIDVGDEPARIEVVRQAGVNDAWDIRALLRMLWACEAIILAFDLGAAPVYSGAFNLRKHLRDEVDHDLLKQGIRRIRMSRDSSREGFLAADREARRRRTAAKRARMAEFEKVRAPEPAPVDVSQRLIASSQLSLFEEAS